jgi:hypothetical protein
MAILKVSYGHINALCCTSNVICSVNSYRHDDNAKHLRLYSNIFLYFGMLRVIG